MQMQVLFFILASFLGCSAHGENDIQAHSEVVPEKAYSLLHLFSVLEDGMKELIEEIKLVKETKKDADISKLQKEIELLKEKTDGKDANIAKLQEEIELLKEKTDGNNRGSSSIFVRWGRTECPKTRTEMVYRGYTAGRHHNKGGGTSILCLPETPTWNAYHDAYDSYRGFIWGTEIDMDPASERKVFTYNVNGHDMPCVVCLARYTVTHMFPGRANCFPGWSMQYTGYLMTNYRNNAPSLEYFCLDKTPEGSTGGIKEDHQNIIFLVEARCGSLPCPPYVEGREVACSVCSK